MRLSIQGFCFVAVILGTGASQAADFDKRAFIQNLNNIKTIGSTIPSNGDVNPYGVAIVRQTAGNLKEGSVLVSNFNASSNLQGTGTTIDQISSNGDVQVFAQLKAADLPGPCPGGVGLTTALVALSSGLVIVGSLPTSDGTSAAAKAGCLIVLNSKGQPISTMWILCPLAP